MNARYASGLVLVVAAGCGAAPPGVRVRPECAVAREEADRAWTEGADPGRSMAHEPLEADRVLARLEAHVGALEVAPREVGDEEAMELSSALMDAIDAMGAALPRSLRDRADDAAEGLLTERSEEHAPRAARGAAEALEAALRTVRPEGRDPGLDPRARAVEASERARQRCR